MRNLRPRPVGLTLLVAAVATAFGNLLPQGSRPIDGDLGIDSVGRITGILRTEPESTSGARVSLAVAVGSYASESDEDAAVLQGTNGSQNFKVVSAPGSVNTIDLSAPWAPGVSLPICENATLIVRTIDIRTGGISISRNRLSKGVFMTIQAKRGPAPIEGQIVVNPPSFDPPVSKGVTLTRPKSRSLPIDGLAGMDNTGVLTGSIRMTEESGNIYVAFSPGSGQSFPAALSRIENKIDGYVPFTAVRNPTILGSLDRLLRTPDSPTETVGGMIIVKQDNGGADRDLYTYLTVSAGKAAKPIPRNNPISLPGSSRRMRTNPSIPDRPASRSLPIDGVATIAGLMNPGTLKGEVTWTGPVDFKSYSVGFAPDINDLDSARNFVNRNNKWVELGRGIPQDLGRLFSGTCRTGTLLFREIDSKGAASYAVTKLTIYKVGDAISTTVVEDPSEGR